MTAPQTSAAHDSADAQEPAYYVAPAEVVYVEFDYLGGAE